MSCNFRLNQSKGFLVFETGEVFQGLIENNPEEFTARSGELVFNTSHFGYEEMATDPSYYSQILVCSAPMQGNYGVSDNVWESDKVSINGFICLEMQNSSRESSWLNQLEKNNVPVLTNIDTRSVVLRLREAGSVWGAVVVADSISEAKEKGMLLIENNEDRKNSNWSQLVTCAEFYEVKGKNQNGPRVAVYDFGCKRNIIRELADRCSVVGVFPCHANSSKIKEWNPDGVLLSNGPGDPGKLKDEIQNVKELIAWKPLFGICLGHQILSIALGGKTYKMKFGHRGGNHPVQDLETGAVYMTSQNHGYAVEQESLPENVKITHVNLHDQSVAGISFLEKDCSSVQFHPESHPGPRESVELLDGFISRVKEKV